MKKTVLFLTALMISLNLAKGQNPFVSCIINFDDNPCWEASYYDLDIPGSDNIWQVCTPHKTVFDSAFSAPHAILTDSTGSYPMNTASSFIIKFRQLLDCECIPVIGGYYMFDSDSLNDYGMIEFSLDHGTTWLNALADSVIPPDWWDTPKPVLTGRIHQWTYFYARLWYFPPIDTVWYRYTFISDDIETNQEGWVLDDIDLIEHIEGIRDIGPQDEIDIYPNPANGLITISAKDLHPDTEVSVYDILGQLRLRQPLRKNKEEIDISGLTRGIYLVRVPGRKNSCSRRVIKD